MTQDSNSRMELRSRCSPEEREAKLSEIESRLVRATNPSDDVTVRAAQQVLAFVEVPWLIAELRSTASALDEAKADSARLDYLDSVEEVDVDLADLWSAKRIARYHLGISWRAERGDDAHSLRDVLDAAMASKASAVPSRPSPAPSGDTT